MSKFAERIKSLQGATSGAIGFKKRAAEGESARMLLVMDITDNLLGKSKEVAAAGADAVLIQADRVDAAVIGKHTRSASDVPLGVSTGALPVQGIKTILGTADFIVFDLNTPVASLVMEGPGRVLKLEKMLTPSQMKALNDLDLGIYLVYLHNIKTEVDLDLLISCQLVEDALHKPVMVNAGKKSGLEELTQLQAAGVRALLLPATVSAQEIKELKGAIASLPAAPRKKKAAGHPILPLLGNTAVREQTEEGGEEEGEEDE